VIPLALRASRDSVVSNLNTAEQAEHGMADEPGSKTTGNVPKAETRSSSDPGQLSVDDRGNITWEWKDQGDLLADDELGAAERVRALVDPRLAITDDDGDLSDPLKVNPKSLKTGYNPYNSGALGKQAWKKNKDLRELSKWIELKKKTATKDET
jgi:hypothetical protein